MFLAMNRRFALLCVIWFSLTIGLFIILQRPTQLQIDLGTSQDQHLTRSFYQAETAPDGTLFRWSSADAAVGLPGANAARYLVDLRINGDFRRAIASPELQIAQGHAEPLRFELEEGWRVYHVLLPEPLGNGIDKSEFRLLSRAYEHEKRSLGVPIDWLSVREAALGKDLRTLGLQTLLFGALLVGLLVSLLSLDQLLCSVWKQAAFWRALLIFVLIAGFVLYGLWNDRYGLFSRFSPTLIASWAVLAMLTPGLIKLLAWMIAEPSQALEGYQAEPEWRLSLLWWWFYALAAAIFTWIYFATTVQFEDATLAALADFSAFRPYQYRVLLPSLVHGLAWLLPLPVEWIYMGLTWAISLALLVAFRTLCSYWLQGWGLNLAVLLLLYAMLWNYAIISIFIYPSDILAILLFVLGLLCLFQGRMRFYYAVFVLGCFNRETVCFLTFAMLFLYLGRRSLIYLAWQSIAQFALWFAIKSLLTYLFRENYGESVFQNQIANNLHFFADLLARDVFALWSLANFGGLWLLIPFVWKNLPTDLRRLALVILPFMLGMSVVGLLYEVRIYSEIVPLVCCACSIGAVRVLQWKPEITFDRRSQNRLEAD